MVSVARTLEEDDKVNLKRAHSAEEAHAAMDRAAAENEQYDAALLDIVIAHTRRGPPGSVYLGLTVGQRAAKVGIKRIAFLSVIERSEVESELQQLITGFASIEFRYFNKADLFDRSTRRVILDFVRGGK